MNFLPVPKSLKWLYGLEQRYRCPQTVLVTSGCSFTASTLQLETAASWPGYVIDRCRFDRGVDWSYPGAGNEYIGDSILNFFFAIPDDQINQYMAIVMWSGIDRMEDKILGQQMPNLNGVTYRRLQDTGSISKQEKINRATTSTNKIFQVFEYLSTRKISFVFTFYSNLLFPPYIPKRDSTFEFDSVINKKDLNQLRSLPWIPLQPLDFLYEYAFINDYLNKGDGFHPTAECNLSWTDSILLPCMQKQNLITPI